MPTKDPLMKQITITALLTALFIFTFSAVAPALEKDGFFNTVLITQKDGLSDNKVTSISRDTLGTYWIGTMKGLDRICEGKVIHYDSIPQFRNREIRFTATDGTGQIWAGVFGGLFLYDYRTDTFRKMNAGDTMLHPISYDTASDGMVFYTEEGFVKYGYKDNSMKIIYTGSDTFLRYSHFSLSSDTSAVASINYDGIYKIDFSTGNKTLLHALDPKSNVNDLMVDSRKRIWTAIYNVGLYCLSPDGQNIVKFFPQNGTFLNGNIAVNIYEHNEKLYIATDGGGVLTIDISSLKTSAIDSLIWDRIPEQAQNVKTMLISDGQVWLGTVHHGIVHLENSPVKFLNDTDFGFGKDRGANGSIISAITEDPYHNIWIGTDGAGISIYSPATEKCTPLDGLSRESITSITAVNQDWMLVAAYSKGLYLCNIHTKEFKAVSTRDPEANKMLLEQDIIIKLKQSSDGKVLISARDLYVFDPFSGKITAYGLSGMSNFRIADSGDEFTFIYNSFEIYCIDSSTEKATLLFRTHEGDISQIKLTGDELWIIKSYALSKLDLESLEIKNIEFPYNGQILSMETDLSENLWLTTKDKVIRFEGTSPEQYAIISDGFSANEFTPDATLYSNSGEIYLGGNTGLCTIKSSTSPEETVAPSLALLSVSVNGEKTGYSISGPKKTPMITVPWKYSSLDFSICSAGGNALKRNKFRYTIDNKEKHTVIYSDNHLSLPTLSPGSYHINIASKNMADKWIEHTDVLTITVTPPRSSFFIVIGAALVIIAIIVLCIYLYHRKEKIKAARLYRQRKEKLAENKISFLTNISHELRTPLTLIYAPLKRLMEKDTGSSGIQKSDLSGILAQTKYMISLINMVLDSRKLEEGYGKLNLQPHDLNAWLQATVNEFRSEYESKGISIRLEADEKISSVTYDEGKFHIILSNLLMNAWKYSEPHTEVTVRSSEKDGRIRIEVSDQGIGINGVDTETLFGRFVQAHKQSNGFGLGLAYTKQLVEAHPGGTIGAFSNKSQGSTFWFEIPEGLQGDTQGMAHGTIESEDYETPVQDSAEPHEAAREDNIINIDTSAYSVLIAEDEPELLMFLKQELSGSFKKVYAAPDGKEAYGMALKTIPDIIVSDVMMPFMDGYELCRKIKNDIKVSHIPVILLTAQAEQGHRAEGYKSGADIFLAKPFDIPTLISAISNTLYSREMIKEKYRNLSTVTVSVAEDTFSNADEQFMLKIDKFIEENISNDSLNAQMIAEYACMGRASFYKKVKEILGIGIIEYVTRKRMALAASLLKSTDMQISEIALKAGYPDNQYFSRAFKQHFGQSPSAYRKGCAG